MSAHRMGGGRVWYACDADLHQDERIADLGEAHGPAAASSWVWLLGRAKRAANDGTVAIRWRHMVHDVWLDSHAEARAIVEAIAQVGLIHVVSIDDRGAIVTVRGWSRYQPKTAQAQERKARERARKREGANSALESQSHAPLVTPVTPTYIQTDRQPDPTPSARTREGEKTAMTAEGNGNDEAEAVRSQIRSSLRAVS